MFSLQEVLGIGMTMAGAAAGMIGVDGKKAGMMAGAMVGVMAGIRPGQRLPGQKARARELLGRSNPSKHLQKRCFSAWCFSSKDALMILLIGKMESCQLKHEVAPQTGGKKPPVPVAPVANIPPIKGKEQKIVLNLPYECHDGVEEE